MPNRIIKESICRSDDINSLSWFEEVLFYRLMVNCDDYGRFDGREKIISSYCFPLKDIKESEITKALKKLSAEGLITRYHADGKSVIQLSTWEEHQRIRNKVSKYPGIEDATEVYESAADCCQLSASRGQLSADCGQASADCGLNPIQSNPNPNTNPNTKRARVYSDDPKLDEAIRNFIDHRKTLKKPMSDHAIELFEKRLDEMANSVQEKIELIDYAINKGWQTVYPIDEKARSGTTVQSPKIHNFPERHYDYAVLEAKLTQNGGT